MNKIHAKSICCRAKIIRFGPRRRQCTLCKKTWRVRGKRRGRKKIRITTDPAIKYLKKERFSCYVSSRYSKLSRSSLQSRMTRSLQLLDKKLSWPKIPNGPLIAIADCAYLKINQIYYTVYIFVLRPAQAEEGIICKPYFTEGNESWISWKQAYARLPQKARKSIRTLVCDGASGLISIAKRNNLILQRCHFHLIASFQGRCSRSRFSRQRNMGSYLYQRTLAVLRTQDKRVLEKNLQDLRMFLLQTSSPQLKKALSGFIKNHNDYRSYLKYPEFNLPTTSNTAESVVSTIRDLLHRIKGTRTIVSAKLWITALLKHRQTVKCNGHLPTKFSG